MKVERPAVPALLEGLESGKEVIGRHAAAALTRIGTAN